MSDIDYSQQRSLNLGIAIDTGSLGAAAVYDDLVYAQKVFGEGYFFRSYDQMMKRFPLWSERTIRTYVRKLEEQGWVSTKVMKVNGKPIVHYKVCRFLSAKFAETKETAKIAETINIETTKKLNTDSVSLGDKNNSADGPAPTTRVHGLLTALITIINPKEKPTDERIRMLNARLKDYTWEEIQDSARAFSKSEWHRKNKQMSVDNLLAPSKFGRWFAQRVEAGSTEVVPDFSEDDDGNRYWRGEKITPENQDRILKEQMEA